MVLDIKGTNNNEYIRDIVPMNGLTNMSYTVIQTVRLLSG